MRILTAFLLLMLLPLSAQAAVVLERQKANDWRERISKTCYATYTSVNKNESDYSPEKGEAGCRCVARNFVRLAQETSSATNVEKALAWVNRYYGRQLTPAESKYDEFGYEDYIMLIGEGCIVDGDFNYPAK